MKSTRFWRIDIEKGMEKISSMIVPVGQISDKKIEELLKVLICKYMLDDEEALSSFCIKSTKRHQDLLKFYRSTDNKRIYYSAQMSSFSIIIMLTYDYELTQSEKNQINKTSSLKLN